mgnify:CR=1 FL=1
MNTDQKLNKLDDFLHTISTETTTGLGGEAGYYVFSYDPKDEMKSGTGLHGKLKCCKKTIGQW